MNVKESYTPTEWKQRETYYAEKVSSIDLPDNITTSGIKKYGSMIDSLLGESTLELAFCKRKFESMDRMRKLTEKQLFFYIKQNGATFGVKTVNEIDGAVALAMSILPANDVLQGIGWNNNQQRIEQILTNSVVDHPATKGPMIINAITTTEQRLIFIQSIVEILKDKQGALITLEGALKLETSVSRHAM
jgi:hypothetical protein